jgi:hypothetical protein
MTQRTFDVFNATLKTGTLNKDAAVERRLIAERPGTPAEGAAAEAAINRIDARQAPALVPGVPAVVADPLIGLALRLDRSCDRLHACCRTPAGAHVGVIEQGTGPHGHGIRCDQCGQHRGWLPRAAGDLLAQLFRAGRLSALPTLRDRGIVP